jgi:hypothetical protein
MFDKLFLDVCQAIAVFMELAYQTLKPLGMGELVILPAENRNVLARLIHALLRGAALHVKVQLSDGTGIDITVLQNAVERCEFLLVCHILPPVTINVAGSPASSRAFPFSW